jgi:hypothetical protein
MSDHLPQPQEPSGAIEKVGSLVNDTKAIAVGPITNDEESSDTTTTFLSLSMLQNKPT